MAYREDVAVDRPAPIFDGMRNDRNFQTWCIEWAGGTPPLGTPPGLPPCLSHGAYAFSKFDGNGLHYKDSVKSYSTVEPAIDYTSSSLLMFARRAAGAPSSTISVLSRREQVSIK